MTKQARADGLPDLELISDIEDDDDEQDLYLNMSNNENPLDDETIIDNNDEGDLNISSDMSSLHFSHLGDNSSVNTTQEELSFGGAKRKTVKKRKTSTKKRKTSSKKRKTATKKRKSAKKGKTIRRKQRGGACYGNGVGANAYDPNFSIFNTRELQLFPYKPTN